MKISFCSIPDGRSIIVDNTLHAHCMHGETLCRFSSACCLSRNGRSQNPMRRICTLKLRCLFPHSRFPHLSLMCLLTPSTRQKEIFENIAGAPKIQTVPFKSNIEYRRSARTTERHKKQFQAPYEASSDGRKKAEAKKKLKSRGGKSKKGTKLKIRKQRSIVQ